MSDLDDIDALAGEYVLGTLDPGERAAVAARRQREPALDRAILEWERRLGPLAAGVRPVPPPPGLLDRIAPRLSPALHGLGAGTQAGKPSGAGADVLRLERRLRSWQWATAGAAALAASLAIVVGVREATRPSQSYVAVFVQDDVTPSFVMSVDLDTRTVTVRAVAARPQPNRSYQLWIQSDQLGPAPRSLGLIEIDAAGTSRRTLELDRALLRAATFGVSVEPLGGSPTGRPTSPALHSKLIPASL